jgi:hypothetical protein
MLMIFGKNFGMVVVHFTKVMVAVKLAKQFIDSIKPPVFFCLQLCVRHVELYALASSSNEFLPLNTISWGYFLSQNHNPRNLYHKTPTFGVIVSHNTLFIISRLDK